MIFDLDNTFYTYEPTHQIALEDVFNEQSYFTDINSFNIEYYKSKKTVKDLLGNNPSKHSKLLYFKNMFETHLSLKEITRLTEIYWESFIQKADISKEVIEKLSVNKSKDDYYILCTNQNTNTQLKKISSWGLDLFNLVITSEEVGYEKPDTNFFTYVEEIIKKRDISFYDFYAIGDDFKNDIEFWKDKYNAKSYLIDNSVNRYENINDVVHTNINHAIEDILD